MSALELGFLISFVTWVFPLLSLGLFSYGLALHSKRSTGAVHFFFAAFAAFCRAPRSAAMRSGSFST